MEWAQFTGMVHAFNDGDRDKALAYVKQNLDDLTLQDLDAIAFCTNLIDATYIVRNRDVYSILVERYKELWAKHPEGIKLQLAIRYDYIDLLLKNSLDGTTTVDPTAN